MIDDDDAFNCFQSGYRAPHITETSFVKVSNDLLLTEMTAQFEFF